MRTHFLTGVALVACLCAAAPAEAGKAQELYDAATKAYHEGQKALSRSRKPGANQFQENETAIVHLEQAQRLLEQYLGLKPDDSAAERVMQDVCSLLFWCHKMSPMVDPEETEDNPEEEEVAEDPPEEEEPGVDPEEAKRAEEEAKARAAEEAKAQAEQDAAKHLEDARAFLAANPDDGMGALSKFFFVAETYPTTAAGAEAKSEAEKLQEKLFAVKPVVPAKKKKKPLTSADKKVIEKELKSWLSNRMKVRCASCSGNSYTECRKCKGTGKIQKRAGRRETCRKCKRGKVYCKRRTCSEGIDTRFLEKVVIDARAPYYQESLKALLGGKKKAIDNFLEALAASLAQSPRAPATISRCADELQIAPVQLRDIIEAHGPDPGIVTPFSRYSINKLGRKTTFELKGDDEHEEAVTFEQTPDGKWWVKKLH